MRALKPAVWRLNWTRLPGMLVSVNGKTHTLNTLSTNLPANINTSNYSCLEQQFAPVTQRTKWHQQHVLFGSKNQIRLNQFSTLKKFVWKYITVLIHNGWKATQISVADMNNVGGIIHDHTHTWCWQSFTRKKYCWYGATLHERPLWKKPPPPFLKSTFSVKTLPSHLYVCEPLAKAHLSLDYFLLYFGVLSKEWFNTHTHTHTHTHTYTRTHREAQSQLHINVFPT